MNERIKELMIEAGIYECDDFEPHPTFKKFAELIVKKCADMVESSSLPDAYSEPCLAVIAEEIKEHFGVE